MNLLLLSHGTFCEGLMQSYEMIAGHNQNIHALALDDDGIATFTNRLQNKVTQLLEQGDLLVLADLKGGTPFNEAYLLYLSNKEHMRLIAGMNLAMLIETGLMLQNLCLQDAFELAISCGKQSIEGILEEDSEEEMDF